MTLDWQAAAACDGHEPEMWFPTDSNDREQWSDALTICQTCPVRTECLDHGTRTYATGIWGGTNDTQRGVRRHHLGLPRKRNSHAGPASARPITAA